MHNRRSVRLSGRAQLLLIMFVFLAIFTAISVLYNGVKYTFFPPPTQTPYPTYTPYPTVPPTKQTRLSATHPSNQAASIGNCIHWEQVTKTHIGQTICVYGNAYRNSSVSGTTTQITFTDDPNAFFLASGTYYYPDVKRGDCVMAQGEVLANTYNTPYIDIDDGLKNCN